MEIDFLSKIFELNWLGILTSSIVSFVIGFIWYHWAVFGKLWAINLGMTKEEADNTEGMGTVFLISIVVGVLKVIFVAIFMEALGINSVAGGLILGLTFGLAFISTSMLYHDGFARRLNLATFINLGHDIFELAIIGAIYSFF